MIEFVLSLRCFHQVKCSKYRLRNCHHLNPERKVRQLRWTIYVTNDSSNFMGTGTINQSPNNQLHSSTKLKIIVYQRTFSLLAIWCLRPWVRIPHSTEEDNLSHFDSDIACLCQSIGISNNKHENHHCRYERYGVYECYGLYQPLIICSIRNILF